MANLRSVVERFWDRFEANDFESLSDLMSVDGDYVMPGGMRLRGPDQIVPLLQAYGAAFPDMRHEILDTVENGDKIAVELRVTATHTGTMRTPNGDIPATGKHVTWESVDFITISGGKVASWHTYFDQLSFLTQLGLVPDPSAA